MKLSKKIKKINKSTFFKKKKRKTPLSRLFSVTRRLFIPRNSMTQRGSYVYRTRTRICTRADRELEESLKRDPLSRAAYAFAYYIVISLPALGGARNALLLPRGEGGRREKIEAKIEFLPRDRRLGDILTPYPWRTDRSESAVTLLSSRGRSTAILTTIRAHANKCTVLLHGF